MLATRVFGRLSPIGGGGSVASEDADRVAGALVSGSRRRGSAGSQQDFRGGALGPGRSEQNLAGARRLPRRPPIRAPSAWAGRT